MLLFMLCYNIYYSAFFGQAGDDRHALNTPASPSWIPAFAGRLRASMPSRRIQDILSINDGWGAWRNSGARRQRYTPKHKPRLKLTRLK